MGELRLRWKIVYLILFKWTGMYSTSEKDTGFICGNEHKHYVVSVSKPRLID